MGKIKIGSVLLGQRKTAIFSILSTCNCKCDMCDMWKKPPKKISKGAGIRVIDEARKNKVLVISFTGGEPFIHENLNDFVKQASDNNMIAHIPSNGSLCTSENLKELKESGLNLLGISIDSHTAKIHNSVRKHPNLFKKATNSVKLAKKLELPVNINSLINKHNWDKLDKLVSLANNTLGVGWAFCFPTFSPNKEYFASSSKEIDLTKEQLTKALESILDMKKSGSNVMNSKAYIKDCLNYLNKKKTTECRAGKDVYFISWDENIYQCFNKLKKLNKKGKWVSEMPNCDACFLQCFREPSIFYNKWVALTNPGEFLDLLRYSKQT